MAHVSVDVPAALVGPLRDTLVLLYHATAESLHLALRAFAEHRASVDEVHQHRARLAQLDGLLAQVGWPPATPAESADLVVRGPADILHDAAYGALIDAGERLAAACGRGWRGEAEPESVRALAREVIELDALLRRVDAGLDW
jgi:hypothetical protein